MRRNRRTKLIATLGPASQDDAILRKLFEAGADVFRINMSHSSHQGLNERVAQLRRIEAELGQMKRRFGNAHRRFARCRHLSPSAKMAFHGQE